MTLLSYDRFRRLSYALICGWILGAILYLLLGTGTFTTFYPGDLPGFYVPGVILERGLFHELYNFELQRVIENEFWPTPENKYYAFAYPPYTAILLWPLAWFPPITAKILWTVLQIAALCGTFLLLSWQGACPARARVPSWIFLASCAPVMTSVMGAQNTCFSAFLFAGTYVFMQHGSSRANLLAGIFAGALLYKPQFGLILVAYLLCLRNWKALGGAGLIGAIYYLMGASISGWMWPAQWISHASTFGLHNYTVNGHQMVSANGLLFSLTRMFSENSSHLSTILSVSHILSLLLLGGFFAAVAFRKIPSSKSFALVVLAAVCLSPQTLFYDFGIALLFLPIILPRNEDGFLMLVQALVLSWLCEAVRPIGTVPAYLPLVAWYSYVVFTRATHE